MKTVKLTFTILLILNFISCKKEKTINKNDTVIKETIEVLSPPIPALNIPHSNFKIDAIKDTIINYKNGTKILIPKNAFLD
ncbi:hypothetical protein OAX11_03635, partial [Flavobacteriaceae bacterium]|nr:hypothetical protein [Flavobacteriaceae bacterium]